MKEDKSVHKQELKEKYKSESPDNRISLSSQATSLNNKTSLDVTHEDMQQNNPMIQNNADLANQEIQEESNIKVFYYTVQTITTKVQNHKVIKEEQKLEELKKALYETPKIANLELNAHQQQAIAKIEQMESINYNSIMSHAAQKQMLEVFKQNE